MTPKAWRCNVIADKRLLSLMLLVGALLGIFSQPAGRAAGPMWRPVAAQPLAGDEAAVGHADCMKMMDKQYREMPCKGLTLDCIAAMAASCR